MIVLDIETSGLDVGKCGIWQIGALEYESEEEFLEEARIDDDDMIAEEALTVTGKNENELRNKNKQSQQQLIENFLEWIRGREERLVAGHNVGWDIMFLQDKCVKYGIHDRFREVMGYRSIDLHTLAQLRYKEKYGEYKLENRRSDMGLSAVLEFCGLKDERRKVVNGKIVKEGKPHNALEDAKLTAECFRRLL